VTVLFTDLVGSTAWRTRVGEAVADVRTAELEAASRELVAEVGGTVVKSVGDGIMATFDSAVAALEVAARLQAVATLVGPDPRGASLRIGISTGDMVEEHGDWLGSAAIEASRLCAAADGGATLIADVTVRLAGSRFERQRLRLLGERTCGASTRRSPCTS
jgi:class 3 adenylate cyclase